MWGGGRRATEEITEATGKEEEEEEEDGEEETRDHVMREVPPIFQLQPPQRCDNSFSVHTREVVSQNEQVG